MAGKQTSEPKPAKERQKNGKPMPPVEHQFKPGNPGRPKGSRNKLGEQFLDDLYADWQKHGIATLERVREDKPDAYLKVVASILPKDLNINVNAMDDMSDDELIARIRGLDTVIRPFLDAQGADRSRAGTGSKATH